MGPYGLTLPIQRTERKLSQLSLPHMDSEYHTGKHTVAGLAVALIITLTWNKRDLVARPLKLLDMEKKKQEKKLVPLW